MRTVETRWFLREDPGLASRLFAEAGTPSTRSDWYAFPCDEGTGTKFREGRLETKLRVRETGKLETGGVTGVIEEWEKWGAPLEADNPPPGELLRSCGWVKVQKTRALRVFAFKESGFTEVTDWQHHWPESGVQFEMTELRVDAATWWTVGLEAFGDSSSGERNLRRIAARVFADLEGLPVLPLASSFAYPHWLRLVAGN